MEKILVIGKVTNLSEKQIIKEFSLPVNSLIRNGYSVLDITSSGEDLTNERALFKWYMKNIEKCDAIFLLKNWRSCKVASGVFQKALIEGIQIISKMNLI